jgi:hypothetical protein
MIKKLTGQVVALALGVILVSSCGKSDSPSVDRKTAIVGNWKATAMSIDTNDNGKIEANEAVATDTAWVHRLFSFTANGTMTITYYNEVSVGSWELLNNNTVVKITDTSNPVPVSYDQILNFSSTTMQLKDTSIGLFFAVTFTKQ